MRIKKIKRVSEFFKRKASRKFFLPVGILILLLLTGIAGLKLAKEKVVVHEGAQIGATNTPTPTIKVTCTDNEDGNRNIFFPGKITIDYNYGHGNKHEYDYYYDYCRDISPDKVYDFVCPSFTGFSYPGPQPPVVAEILSCELGANQYTCSGGACNGSAPTYLPCKDTDGLDNPMEWGIVEVCPADEKWRCRGYSDYCKDVNTLVEQFCDGSDRRYHDRSCVNGCNMSMGVCNPQLTPTSTPILCNVPGGETGVCCPQSLCYDSEGNDTILGDDSSHCGPVLTSTPYPTPRATKTPTPTASRTPTPTQTPISTQTLTPTPTTCITLQHPENDTDIDFTPERIRFEWNNCPDRIYYHISISPNQNFEPTWFNGYVQDSPGSPTVSHDILISSATETKFYWRVRTCIATLNGQTPPAPECMEPGTWSTVFSFTYSPGGVRGVSESVLGTESDPIKCCSVCQTATRVSTPTATRSPTPSPTATLVPGAATVTPTATRSPTPTPTGPTPTGATATPTPTGGAGGLTLSVAARLQGFSADNQQKVLLTVNAKGTSFTKSFILPESGVLESLDLTGLQAGQTYNLIFSSWGFLSIKKNVTLVSGRNPSIGNLLLGTFKSGDLNGDNQVNGLDWSLMKMHYGESSE